MHKQNIIELKNIGFSYGKTKILHDLSLEIHKGDYMAIIGPNGGGKTTLLKLIVGLLAPASGKVELFGVPLRQFKDWQKMGYVSQKATHIDPSFPITVENVVSMGLFGGKKAFQILNRHDMHKLNTALEEVEMQHFRKRLIGDLSGGQQQRVFIARALAAEPEALILDEPTSGVDAKTQEHLYALLKKLNREKGLTIILASHDLEAMEREATELICINKTVVYCGLPKEFRSHQMFHEYEGQEHHFHHKH